MTTTTTEPKTIVATKPTCWVEMNIWRPSGDGKTGSSFAQSTILGRPDRVWSSEDPVWQDLENRRALDFVSVLVGTFTRIGDEFVPNTVKTTHHLRVPWKDGLEKLKFFEQHGRLYDTPESDAVRDHEKAREQGQKDVATAIAEGLKSLAAEMRGVKK